MSLPESYFTDLYERSSDPWSLESRWYESRKYAMTVASLPRQRYRRAFEAGCSVGVLTALLADRCDTLLSVDITEAAVTATRRRLADRDGVQVVQCTLPEEWPGGNFDLIVLSEIGYYLDRDGLAKLIDRAAGALDPDGSLLAVHWRHPVEDYPLGGDDVHEALREDPRLATLAHHEERDFQLDVMVLAPLVSVAEAAGLVSP